MGQNSQSCFLERTCSLYGKLKAEVASILVTSYDDATRMLRGNCSRGIWPYTHMTAATATGWSEAL